MNRQILSRLIQWAADGKLLIDTEAYPLEMLAEAWKLHDNTRKRMVISTPTARNGESELGNGAFNVVIK